MREKFVIGACAVAVIFIAAVVTWPELKVNRVPAFVTSIFGCIGSYRAEHGQAPENMQLLKPCLEGIYGEDSITIESTDDEHYTVRFVGQPRQSAAFRRTIAPDGKGVVYECLERG